MWPPWLGRLWSLPRRSQVFQCDRKASGRWGAISSLAYVWKMCWRFAVDFLCLAGDLIHAAAGVTKRNAGHGRAVLYMQQLFVSVPASFSEGKLRLRNNCFLRVGEAMAGHPPAAAQLQGAATICHGRRMEEEERRGVRGRESAGQLAKGP